MTLSYLGDQVSLDVCDDGRGLPSATGSVGTKSTATEAGVDEAGANGADPPSTRGLGLRGIRDRVEGLDGQLVVESAPGRGTALAVTLPVTEPA